MGFQLFPESVVIQKTGPRLNPAVATYAVDWETRYRWVMSFNWGGSAVRSQVAPASVLRKNSPRRLLFSHLVPSNHTDAPRAAMSSTQARSAAGTGDQVTPPSRSEE